MQDEWHVMHGSASANWMEATFHSWVQMQMQIQERVGLLLVWLPLTFTLFAYQICRFAWLHGLPLMLYQVRKEEKVEWSCNFTHEPMAVTMKI